MDSWKRILPRAAGFGAGFAVVAALIVWLALWWHQRPEKPKPWNISAITASFDNLSTEGDKNTIVFVFTLQNNTSTDYRIADGGFVHLGAVLRKSKAFSFSEDDYLKTDYPLYVPAGSRVRIMLHLKYPYAVHEDLEASDDARHDWGTNLCKFVTKELSNLDGFVMMDDQSRYEITLPNGWEARSKEPLRISAQSSNTQK
jgi:hypothetical protein